MIPHFSVFGCPKPPVWAGSSEPPSPPVFIVISGSAGRVQKRPLQMLLSLSLSRAHRQVKVTLSCPRVLQNLLNDIFGLKTIWGWELDVLLTVLGREKNYGDPKVTQKWHPVSSEWSLSVSLKWLKDEVLSHFGVNFRSLWRRWDTLILLCLCSLEKVLACRWDGVRLPRASGKPLPLDLPEVSRTSPATFLGPLSVWSLEQSRGSRKFPRLPRKFPWLARKFPGPSPRERSTPLPGKPDTLGWLTKSSAQ